MEASFANVKTHREQPARGPFAGPRREPFHPALSPTHPRDHRGPEPRHAALALHGARPHARHLFQCRVALSQRLRARHVLPHPAWTEAAGSLRQGQPDVPYHGLPARPPRTQTLYPHQGLPGKRRAGHEALPVQLHDGQPL